MKIIIARTNKIGDAILTLPMAGVLKEKMPDCKIYYLGKTYVEEIVDACPDIDGFINWDALEKKSDDEAATDLQKIGADILVHANIEKRVFKIAKKANIPQRVATGRRLMSWFYCNKLVNFSRRHTTKTEAQLNLQLIKHLGINPELSQSQLTDYLRFTIKPEWTSSAQKFIVPGFFNLIIHPGSNGSGQEWPMDCFIELIKALPQDRFKILITGTEQEIPRFQPLIDACPHAINLMGKTNLSEMLGLIILAGGLIASSTGTLHLAAVFGKHALGLYTDREYVGYSRWRPLGHHTECLVAAKTCHKACRGSGCACIRKISAREVKELVIKWL